MKLEDITTGSIISGIVPNQNVSIIQIKWHGDNVISLTYRDQKGRTDTQLVYRHQENTIELLNEAKPLSFNANGADFRLAAEAYRISLAHLFDPLLAVTTSLIMPLPHQISAVYESMLPRQPLRFLLADDPGAGKTIMAGLYIKELYIRGEVKKCMIISPGNLKEQWQDELYEKFGIHFDLITRHSIEESPTGNVFQEKDLIICRLDHLSRNPDIQEKIKAVDDWDLIIVDEAHKMSASYFSNELKMTKRFQLGRLLSRGIEKTKKKSRLQPKWFG
jgi:SNF2 family DNA or RNA helicase